MKKQMNSPLILFSLLIILSFLLTASSTKCHKYDRKALLSIKSALGDPYIIITWGQSPDDDCCDWVGVTCNPQGHVSEFFISGDNVSGVISPSIGDLPHLTFMTFHKLTNLTGTIPSTITKLTKLTSLMLDWNALTGPVPAFLSQLPSLGSLSLAFNQFTGSIPATLGSLPLLTFLDLSRNRLSGPIPDSLGGFPSQSVYLYLSHNNLSGPIPKSFSNAKYEVIDLSRNKLTGDASILFGVDKPLQRLDLSRNSFEFDLTNVKLPKDMVALDLNHNLIYGSIPAEFTKPFWQGLNVSYNRLCGEIPVGGTIGERFGEDVFAHNKCLCGPPLSVPCK